MQIIKEIPALETFLVRHPVLRPGKPIETCHFEGDTLETTRHFGYFSDEKLVGVASLFKHPTSLLKEEQQFQLRGMAILPEYQKKGLGEALVNYAETNAAERNGKLIWFNAREIAVPFYKKLGYEIIGDPFDIQDIGKHYIMYKNLKAL